MRRKRKATVRRKKKIQGKSKMGSRKRTTKKKKVYRKRKRNGQNSPSVTSVPSSSEERKLTFNHLPNEIQFYTIKFMDWRSISIYRSLSRKCCQLFNQNQVQTFLLKYHPAESRILDYYRSGGRQVGKKREIRRKFFLINHRRLKDILKFHRSSENVLVQKIGIHNNYDCRGYLNDIQDTLSYQRAKKIRFVTDLENRRLYFIYGQSCHEDEDIVFSPTISTVFRDEERERFYVSKNRRKEKTKNDFFKSLDDTLMYKYVNPDSTAEFRTKSGGWSVIESFESGKKRGGRKKKKERKPGDILRIGFEIRKSDNWYLGMFGRKISVEEKVSTKKYKKKKKNIRNKPRKKVVNLSKFACCVCEFNFLKWTVKLLFVPKSIEFAKPYGYY